MIALLAAAALAAAASPTLPPAPLRDGGVCIGLGWVALRPGETAYLERGPDFDVFRFLGPGDQQWGVYSGFAARAKGEGPVVVSRDRMVIRRAVEDGKFEGYLAEKGRWQNHFFGSVFHDDRGDKEFFGRFDTSARAHDLCGPDPTLP